MKWVILLVILYSLNCKISVVNNKIIDEFGRERIYHGMNVVYKSAPYVPLTGESGYQNPRLAFTETDAKLLQKLGQNVIRLGVMWPGVEPIQGWYNMTYIQEIHKIVDVCREHNIFVVLEYHQDGFSEKFCGEGVPHWAAKNHGFANIYGKFPWPMDGYSTEWKMGTNENQKGIYADFEVPSKQDCDKYGWGKYLTSYTSAINYEWFYTNKHGLRDAFAEYFALLAQEFKDDDAVIGFELLNEPSLTWSIYIFPGLTDSHYLEPFYDAVVKRIHEVDPNRVVLFEPTTWSNEYPDNPITKHLFESRLHHAPGGKQRSNKSILAYHYYPWVNKAFNSSSPQSYFQSRIDDQIKLGVAGFVTEWNLLGISNQQDDSAKETNQLMDVMDLYQQSWMGWTYKGYLPTQEQTEFIPTCTGCGSGLINEISDTQYTVNWETAYIISRPYAQAVQGKIKKMNYDSNKNVFTLIFRLNQNINAPTEIYINTQLDKEGTVKPHFQLDKIIVEIEPNNIMDYQFKNNNIVEIYQLSNLKYDDIDIRIRIFQY